MNTIFNEGKSNNFLKMQECYKSKQKSEGLETGRRRLHRCDEQDQPQEAQWRPLGEAAGGECVEESQPGAGKSRAVESLCSLIP